MSNYGEQLKLDGMLAAESAPSVQEWRVDARIALRDLALRGEPFTSEDLTAMVGLPRGETGQHRNNAVGAVMGAAARAGLIRKVDTVNARRPISHAAKLTVWIGVRDAQ